MRNINVGEHIGGSRRDYRRGSVALTKEEIARMSPDEAALYVRKANIWPPVSWQKLKDAGMTPQCEAFIKLIRDTIAGEPPARFGSGGRPILDAEAAVSYAESVGLLRDALSAPGLRTTEDVCRALSEPITRITGGHLEAKRGGGASYVLGDYAEKLGALGKRFQTLGFEIYRSLIEATLDAVDKAGGRADIPLQPVRMTEKLRTEIEKRCFGAREGDESVTEEAWSLILRPKRRKSAEEAGAAAQALADKFEVVGARRDPARNVTPEELMKEFGLRGVQFGRSLPDRERQAHVNLAYDAFDQLAAALGIPRKAIGFDGRLGLAFGSRGRGRAFAHFETITNVINLTRNRGGGSLAHEWMHAYDYMSDTHQGLVSSRMEGTLVNSGCTADDLVWWGREQTQSALRTLAGIAEKTDDDGPLEETPLFKELQAGAEKTLGMLRPLAEGFVKTNRIAELPDAFKAAEDFAADAVLPAVNIVVRWEAESKDCLQPLRQIVNRGWQALSRGLWHTAAAEALVKAGIVQKPVQPGCDTEFYRRAQAADGGSGYLVKTTELFARAGSAFVWDRLQAKGMMNDYLVSSWDSPDENKGIANNVPYGWERRRISAAFEQSFSDFRERMKHLECEPIVESARRPERTARAEAPEQEFQPLKSEESKISTVENPAVQEAPQTEPQKPQESVADVLGRIRAGAAEDVRQGIEGGLGGLGGLFSAPLIVGAKPSEVHPGKLLLMLFDDSDLNFGGRVEYQLVEAAKFGESVEGARLAVPGPTVSLRSILDGSERLVDPSDVERTEILSSASLQRTLEDARSRGFAATLNEEDVMAVCKALASRYGEIAANRERQRKAEKEERRRGRPKRGRRR